MVLGHMTGLRVGLAQGVRWSHLYSHDPVPCFFTFDVVVHRNHVLGRTLHRYLTEGREK